MSFLLFFEHHIDHIVERTKAVFNNKVNINELEIFKKEFAEAIRETDKHILLKQISDKFNLALWAKDKNSIFIFSNKPCMNLILRSSEPTFKSNGDFSNDALAVLCIKSDYAVIKKGEDMRFIEFAVYEDGERIWIDVYKSLLRHPGGEICGTLGSAINITGIVPDDVKEKYKIAQSIEIDISVILTADRIKQIIMMGQSEFEEEQDKILKEQE